MQDNRDNDSLKQQVQDIMDEKQSTVQQDNNFGAKKNQIVRKKKNKFLKAIIFILVGLLLIILLMIGTKTGRKIIYKFASGFIYSNMNNEDIIKDYQSSTEGEDDENSSGGIRRHEDYVTNYLIFGIEEFGGAENTDSMMIASINTKDNTIKLTSLLRDSYVEIPGHNPNKLNAAFSRGGAKSLVDTIELNYKVQIDGYASVNFKSFEKIVDKLGGISIELGKEEVKYLNSTNYISKKENRNLKIGVNHLNGNQVVGYCRVRKVKTLGGANNDYGRIVRQQRALKAIFDSYKSKSVFKLVGITKDCLSYVTTNLSENQIEKAIADVVENKIKTLDTFRVPVDGAFDAPREYKGVGDPLVLDWKVNRIELYKYIFLDTEKEAIAALATKE